MVPYYKKLTEFLNPDFPDENHSLCIMRRRLTA